MARLLVPIPESMAMLGDVGRTTLWKLVKAKELQQVNIGRRSFITAESLEAYVDRLRETNAAESSSARPPAAEAKTVTAGASTE